MRKTTWFRARGTKLAVAALAVFAIAGCASLGLGGGFQQPIVTARLVQELAGVSQPTASALVKDLARIGILTELTGRRRDRLFAYSRYIDLFPGASERS